MSMSMISTETTDHLSIGLLTRLISLVTTSDLVAALVISTDNNLTP